MRMEFVLPLTEGERGAFERAFARDVGDPLGLDWRVWYVADRKRMGILVSRTDHCLLDLLWRWRRGEFEADVVAVASNHPDLRADVDAFALPYHHVPVDRADKAPAEARLLELLGGNVDVVVLARYMQILSGEFLDRLAVPVINIHHSFLPVRRRERLREGEGPRRQAHRRHRPLRDRGARRRADQIEQDVIRVSHRDTPARLARLGSDIERTVLARAVGWHCEDRVLVHDKTTVVF